MEAEPAGDEPGWESPWGFGRPGWHLECSAMSAKHLGQTFDIHGGGIDLVFPHHENEVAQSTCAHGTKIMANIWMHNGHLQVEGAEDVEEPRQLRDHRRLARSEVPGEVIRYQLLMAHYRQPLDWTAAMTRPGEAGSYKVLESLARACPPARWEWMPVSILRSLEALEDDLNTPEAIAALHALEEQIRGEPEGLVKERLAAQLFNSFALLGLEGVADFEERLHASEKERLAIDETVVRERIEARIAARKAKNWAEADRIRDEARGHGHHFDGRQKSRHGRDRNHLEDRPMSSGKEPLTRPLCGHTLPQGERVRSQGKEPSPLAGEGDGRQGRRG